MSTKKRGFRPAASESGVHTQTAARPLPRTEQAHRSPLRVRLKRRRGLRRRPPSCTFATKTRHSNGVCAIRRKNNPRPSHLPYNPSTALRRRDRVATGTMWEGRAAPVVRFGRFRPAEPRGSRYVRPTGMTGLPLVETALRVGCSPLASAGTRRPHAGEWKSEITKRRAGRLRGATINYCEALFRRPAPSSSRRGGEEGTASRASEAAGGNGHVRSWRHALKGGRSHMKCGVTFPPSYRPSSRPSEARAGTHEHRFEGSVRRASVCSRPQCAWVPDKRVPRFPG